MREFLFHRLRDKGLVALVAFLFSVGLWFRVVGGEKIEASKAVRIDYKVPKDLTLFQPAQTEVSVRVRGPAPFVSEFQKQDLSVPVDLTEMGSGEHEISFRAEQFRVPLGIDLTRINPPSVKVFLDREVTRRLAVRPVFSTQLPDDYKIESVVVQPSSVAIRGSRIRLGILSSVPTRVIHLTENTLNQHFEVELNPSDFWTADPSEKVSTVHVEVNLSGPSKSKIFRDVPIKLRVGAPGRSRLIDLEGNHVKLRPRTVNLRVEGPSHLLDSMNAESFDVWIQVSELKKGNQQARLTWKLSPELRILDHSADSVIVSVP